MLVETFKNSKIGGTGCIVEIDKSLFVRRKNNVIAIIFGGI